ncbi:X-linked interleukin-1 receptor accessory protein-like 2 [Sinocyclocheilus anshuiensis]|uniref:X-linked interleukin-1 receptor accessory protein-like 2 n=1 Tax=Sinocyclocheilus anshuiensis TaxID=1608454 RepID=UPI0007B8BB85|nr:PREDICTED: X-linked interleukin-1 receptor accessory protein-like 2 [Sinocyclocheilus anshuiensis]
MKLAGFMLLLINSAASINLKYISKRNSVDGCIDWLVDLKTYRVLAGEPLRVKCALFYSYIRTNYSVTQNAKLRLIWYRNKGDSEEPIIFSGHRLSKEGDSIWFRSAETEDNGFYTCVLRNSTYCMKVSMSLTVEESEEGLCFSSRIRYQENAEVTKSKMISCPDIDDYLAPYKQPIMTWYKECQRKEWRSSIIINTTSLWIPEVQEDDGGNYTCELRYGSRVVRRTTELKVTALLTTRPPKVLFPSEKQASVIDVQLGMRLVLDCRAFFGYSGDSRPIIYWMKGDKFVEELDGHIRESEVRVVREFLGEKEVELSLIFDAVEETDMGNYTCNVENHIGRGSGSAVLQKKGSNVYRLELVGGLGAIMLILGIFTAIYKCYNVEIMLCYRRHFGSDEADDDNKEYDAYLTYTKVDLESVEREMSEEELFALEILPDVLEKHYGYKLFIPHRDLIPSSSKIHECRTLRTIECSDLCSVINYQELEDLKHTIRVLSLIKWYGPKSSQLQSKFWKRVHYEMPAKRKESVSHRQVLDSGEQGLFGDLQAVSTVAMTATSASLAPAHVEIPDYNEPGHLQKYLG